VWLKAILSTGLVIFAGLQFMGPERTNPPSVPERAITAQVEVPADVDSLLTRSCRNCHSNETQWPLYSYVAPISWLVIHDVNEGRSHMNLSDWNHSPEEAADLLDAMCKQVTKGKMPLRNYAMIHRSARLASPEVSRLCTWSNDASARLMAAH
jgi:hypothetical protein